MFCDSELLEKLCLSLYDVLRPLIIHVVHLETLSELCSILKNEMLEDHVQNNGTTAGVYVYSSQHCRYTSQVNQFKLNIQCQIPFCEVKPVTNSYINDRKEARWNKS